MTDIIMAKLSQYFQHISGWVRKQVIDTVFYD